jgi:beta-galactosidase
MKSPAFAAIITASLSTLLCAQPTRHTTSFDADWRFVQADQPQADEAKYDDHEWQTVDVPHDWSIAGPFDEKNPAGGAGAFLPSGVAWYRKHFTMPATAAGKRCFIEFDGVMQNSDVWINGVHLGQRPFGYVGLFYDLTSHLHFGAGQQNIISVRADTSAQPASRWYAGAGIYRHVRLIVTDAVHFEEHATFVQTPSVSAASATVRVTTRIVNQGAESHEIALRLAITDVKGKTIGTASTPTQTIAAGATADFTADVTLQRPQLWQLDRPNLYHATVEARDKRRTFDDETVTFGVRDAHLESATGFWLNGQNIKLKGVCVHSEASPFGAAVPLAIWERQLTVLRQLGVNAIRTAHNPPAPEFLDLCDRMGFLVMDEMFDCWTVGKNHYDYHLYFDEWSRRDLRDTVRRDRNHPCIILWSAGNEIHDTPKAELANRILKGLVEEFHANDPTRPVTQALFRPNVSHDYDNGLADLLDVVGTNYRDGELLAAWRAKPTRKILGTEQRHDRETWLFARDNPQHAGQFLWTGTDYLGESRHWPLIAAGSGLIDRTGAVKPMGFERQSWWTDGPMVHVTRRIALEAATPTDPGFDPLDRRQTQFSDWSPANRESHDETVEAYSNCDQVKLFLNGKSLGAKSKPADASPRVWVVSFVPGKLEAVATNGGRIVARHDLRTAEQPTKIILTADRPQLTPTWDDVDCVTATVVDANGTVVPTANDAIDFSADGPGAIVAVDSADNESHESFQAAQRRAYQGRCVAYVKATGNSGEIRVRAQSRGLADAMLSIHVSAAAAQ